ncbi:MAG: serine/threonine protein kinase [Stackebrandtia sp.]
MRQGHWLAARYCLEQRIAAGGMGEVWRAHDERLNRTVAVKILHDFLADDVVFRQRFQVEARAIAALRHPGVVSIYDYGDETGPQGRVYYLVMEYVEGRSLQQLINADGELDEAQTMRIIAGTAEALAVAHRAQIIHRDVKPGNILIDADGAPHLVDFGIARTAGAATLTNTGMVMGTVAYVAPEQLRGDEPPTPAADIYSLGVVAYQCLAGRKPFDGDAPATLIAAALERQPPPLTGVSEPVAAIVMRALAKQPADRWDSAEDFAGACRSPDQAVTTGSVSTQAAASDPAADEPTEAVRHAAPSRSDDPDTVPDRKPRRHGALIAVIAFLLVLLLGAGGYLVYLEPWAWGKTTVADMKTEATSSPDDETSSSKSSSSPSKSSDEPETTTSDAEPSTSSDSPEPKSGELPYTEGLDEDEAFRQLKRAGFENITSVDEGDGIKVCGVYRQDPGGGEEYDFSTEVTVYVQLVNDLANCKYGGTS